MRYRLWACLLGLAASGFAQFGEKVTVRLMEIPVQVTDRTGHAILQLSKEDFRFAEDGLPQEITHLYEVKESAIARRQFADFLKEKGITPPAPEVRKRIVVFLDVLHLQSNQYQRLLPALENFLSTALTAGDEAAVFGAMPNLKVLLPWTSSVGDAQVFLRGFTSGGAQALSRVNEGRMVEENIARQGNYQMALIQVRGFAEEQRTEALATVEAMKAAMEFTAGLGGRKFFLYVGEGYSLIPGIEYFYQLERRFPMQASLNDASNFDLSPAFRDLGLFAASHGFVLTAVDSRGLASAAPGSDAEVGSHDPDAGVDMSGLSAAQRGMQDSLELLTEPSGGRAVVNTNDFDAALARAGLELNHYYVLGYQPRHPPDGKVHTLTVRLTNPEFLVNARRSYQDYSEDDAFPLRLSSAVQWESGLENPLGLKVEVGDEKKDGKFYLVPLRIALPRASLVFKDGKTSVKLGILTAEGGKRSDTFIQKLDLNAIQWKDKPILVYTVTLKIRKGDQLLVAGMQDAQGRISLVKTALRLPRK